MKASQFKELIKEAVREVIKEEFSTPSQPVQEQVKYQPTGNPMLDAINETRSSMTSEDYKNLNGGTMQSSMAQAFNKSAFVPQGRAVKPVSDDPQAVAAAVAAAPKQGLDLSQLGFINKAAAIVNTADRKQREKNGL
jgi:hypothetical protein